MKIQKKFINKTTNFVKIRITCCVARRDGDYGRDVDVGLIHISNFSSMKFWIHLICNVLIKNIWHNKLKARKRQTHTWNSQLQLFEISNSNSPSSLTAAPPRIDPPPLHLKSPSPPPHSFHNHLNPVRSLGWGFWFW